MANSTEKKRMPVFWKVFLGYVVVMLCLIGVGLYFFWNYIEAYELSRPQHAIDRYVTQLTPEHICDLSQNVIDQYDHYIQDETACRDYLMSHLGTISYSRNTAKSDDTRTVYTLRSGPQVIGEVAMTPQQTDEYGFVYWEVTEEVFDLSYLMVDNSIEITVPEEFTVSVNGAVLDASYQVETGIQYEVMEEFYDDYDLPCMVTYHAGPFLGDYAFVVTDTEGNVVEIDANTDYDQFVINNCDEAQVTRLNGFLEGFITHLVAFSGSNRDNGNVNYWNLRDYLVENGALDERMRSALATLQYSHNMSDVLNDMTVNHLIDIGNGRYLCDVTYLVDTTGLEGVVTTTNRVRIIVVETEDGLKVEAMTSY